MSALPGRSRPYAKPIVRPTSLSRLHRPIAGVVSLPRHLEWSGSNCYDLDQPGRIVAGLGAPFVSFELR